MKQKYEIHRFGNVDGSNKWAVYKFGKVVQVCQSKEHAQDEMARWIEDDQWNASNR
jgi:hypothetical protein